MTYANTSLRFTRSAKQDAKGKRRPAFVDYVDSLHTARSPVSRQAQSLCFDWANPVHAGNLYENYLQPACTALGLGSVRFHDLRHTFATMNLSAGEHYMQV